jgi:hypothetical protein
MMDFIKSPKTALFFVSIFLFIIPFFWMSPGEMDLGGDSNRLYFYDPINYLQSNLSYAINPGFGVENPLYLSLPFVALLVIIKQIIPSSYFVISLFNSVTLVVAFLAMFGIAKHLFEQGIQNKDKKIAYFVSMFVGFFYSLSPIMARSAWDKALLTHFQIFLNPLLFFLLLKFFETSKFKYLLTILIITFIFSTNFSWAAAPPLLAFYPLALLYLLIYTKIIRKKKLAIRPIVLSIVLFVIIHAFHIVPLVSQFFNQSGAAFARSFTSEGKFDIGLSYFQSIVPMISLSKNLFGLPQAVPSIMTFEAIFVIFPIIFVIGLIVNSKQRSLKKEQKYSFLILSFFLLISIFFATANITKTGLEFYSSLFYLPGFSMFRNFYGQWEFIYLFFLSLAVGFGLLRIMPILNNQKIRYGILAFLVILIASSAIPFLRGDMINLILNKNQKVEFKVPIKMDSEFEKALEYIRNDPNDGKILLLPHTEAFSQMVAGTQGGMYQGPSMISALTGKEDFAGYQVIKPFSDIFLSIAKEKDITNLTTLFNLLNIKYIFYNSDPLIMDYFPDFPYSHVRNLLPQNQTGYKKFIDELPVTKVKDFGTKYHLYRIEDSNYLPHIYVAKNVVTYTKKLNEWGYLSEAFFADSEEKRTVYIESKSHLPLSEKAPQITVTKVNPTKYYVKITKADKPYMLTFSEAFNANWKLFLSTHPRNDTKNMITYFNGDIKENVNKTQLFDRYTFETWGKPSVADNNHFEANGYANAWLISPSDVHDMHEYTLVLEMTSQRLFYIFIPISLGGLIICVVWLLYDLVRGKKNEKT